MLTYSFSEIGSDSLYTYLYKCIKNDVLSGVLAPGSKLPSKRSFAKNLGISTITVENAYAQLLAEGYIYSLPRKGFFVTDLSERSPKSPKANAENFHLFAEKQSYRADFVSNKTNPDNFPFSVWAKLMRETISDKHDELMANAPCGGIIELRTAISQHLKQFRNMDVDPEQIFIGAGTEYLYGLIIQLLGHDKIYAAESPGYQKIARVYESNGAECRYVGLDSEGVLVSELEEKKADVAHVSPSHHFPTGLVTPISRRYELLGWASREEGRYIIEDDYDSEFRLSGKPLPTLQSIDIQEKVIYMNTFAKSLSSTIRISYMVLPRHLAEKFYQTLSFYSCTVSNFEQYVLARFISGGYFEKHINRMRTHYRRIRDELLSAIKESPLSSKVLISEEEAGLHFLMEVRIMHSDEDLVRIAAQHGIHISCLSQYTLPAEKTPDLAEHHAHILVMNYSGIKTEEIEYAISQLNSILGN